MDYNCSFYGSRHRKFFHDIKFVLSVKRVFGEDIAKEALHHILLDKHEKIITKSDGL